MTHAAVITTLQITELKSTYVTDATLLGQIHDLEAAAKLSNDANATFRCQVAAARQDAASLRTDQNARSVEFSNLERQLERYRRESSEELRVAEGASRLRESSSSGGSSSSTGFDLALQSYLTVNLHDVRLRLRASADEAEEVEQRHQAQLAEERRLASHFRVLSEASDAMLVETLLAKHTSAETAAATAEALSCRVLDLERQLAVSHADLTASEKIRAAAAAILFAQLPPQLQLIPSLASEGSEQQSLAAEASGEACLLDVVVGAGNDSFTAGVVDTVELETEGAVKTEHRSRKKLGLVMAGVAAGFLVMRPACMFGRLLRKVASVGRHMGQASRAPSTVTSTAGVSVAVPVVAATAAAEV